MSNEKYLITTGLEHTWPNNIPVLFLGEWCKRYTTKDKWLSFDSETVKYHWDDRKKFDIDCHYLNELYEKTLKVLTNSLNEYHKTHHNAEYWRIILGPWLGEFIEILFDRWEMTNKALSDFKIIGTTIINLDERAMVPKDMLDFMRKCSTDIWNHYIYTQILDDVESSISIDQLDGNSLFGTNNKNKNEIKNIFSRTKKFIRTMLCWLTDSFKINSEYFFIDIYLTSIQQTKLELALKKIPSWFMTRYKSVEVPFIGKRPDFISAEFSPIKFESFLYKAIQKQIPLSYLEGFKALELQVENCQWPRRPRIMMTSGSHTYNDFFKVWAASKRKLGAKLVIAQHASLHGSAKWFSYEKHELIISDKYFSWGWSEVSTDKIIKNSPGKLINSKRKLKNNWNGGLLQILTSASRYSYHLYSSDISSQILAYEEDQVKFAQDLSKDIRSQLTVRPYITNYGWDQKERWNDAFPKVTLDYNSSFYTTMDSNKLLIGTANSSVLFEALAANIPIISFWNPLHWELRESAKPYYDLLINVKILHHSPEKAADFVNHVWDGLEFWWNSIEVQKARCEFCDELANSKEDWIKQWKINLQNITKH
jgi:putative transferase (TIGR04331 family)